MYKAQQTAGQQIADHRHEGHAGAQAVQTVGQVDSVDKEDDAEERDGIVEQAHVHQPKNRELDLRGQQPEAVQAEHEPEGQRDLQNHLLRLGQAEVAMPDDLNEVIQKADEARAEREKQHQHTGLQLRHTKHLRQLGAVHDPDDAQRGQNAQNKAEAAHGGGAVFLAVPCGALLADGLAKVQPVQRRDHEFARHRRDGKAADGCRRQQG